MIYLDNGATTYPKPHEVRRAMSDALLRFGANSGRSGFSMSMNTAEKIYECREHLAEMFGADSGENVAFTMNCTQSLNMAIKGLLHSGDHVVISNLEHNAVARPIETLAKRGFITYSIAKYDPDPVVTAANFEALVTKKTTLIVCMHASNVFGVVFPIDAIGKMAKRNGIHFVVDAAQSAGVLPIDMKESCIDILCMPGHKGLYGPMGTGVMIVNTEEKLQTIIEGGTGSVSAMLTQPDFMPDIFESGTLNTPGIIGLSAGVNFVRALGHTKIQKHEYALIERAYTLLRNHKAVTLYCPRPTAPGILPLLSFNYKTYPSEQTASLLSEKGVAVRAGYHCAYTAHKAFHTEESGAVRIAPSVFTTEKEIVSFSEILKSI